MAISNHFCFARNDFIQRIISSVSQICFQTQMLVFMVKVFKTIYLQKDLLKNHFKS